MAETTSPPPQIGDYQLIKKLGEGGMGAVYKARQVSMERDVALKVLPKQLAKDPTYVERFYREARASAKLDHPNIVRGIAVFEAQGVHCFAMEFIDGDNCAKQLERQGKLAVGDAVKITADVARALEHAHGKGLIHRDIKPENIMIARDGSVKLADLGLAKAMQDDSSITQGSSGFGTPYYMPPEQARSAKNVDQRSDLYALGATMYHLVTNLVPFKGETAMEVLTAKEEGKHTPARRVNPEVPAVLDLLIDKMMAKDPKARFQTATDVIKALENTGLASETLSWVGGGQTPARPAAAKGAAGPAARATAAPGSAGSQTVPGQFFVRYKDKTGKPIKATGDKHQILDLIRKGAISTEAECSRDVKGQYRPLMAFPEFEGVMKARLLKERSDKAAGGGMKDRFAQIDKDEHRRRKMRKVKAMLKRVAGIVVTLAVLGGGGYYAWTKYQESQAPKKSSASSKSSTQPSQPTPPGAAAAPPSNP